MIESYEKRGASVRIERSGRSISTIVTHEHGLARRERGRFHVESLGARPLALAADVCGATDIARTLGTLARGRVEIERLTVAAGVSEQTVSIGDQSVSWSEQSARVHLSLVNRDRALRVTVELGAPEAQMLPVEFATEAADALLHDVPAPTRFDDFVELSPPVSATLWRFVAAHPGLVEGSRLSIAQSVHPGWRFDGAGRRIETGGIGTEPPRALFRPSYRVAPVPAWFHVRATLRGAGKIRRSKKHTRIVALLSPFRLTRASVTSRVLATFGGGSFAANLEIARDRFAASIARIARNETWFPLEAGAWGSDTILEGATLIVVAS